MTPKPEVIATAADCRALAEHEWDQELADDARALWKGGREQYVAIRSAAHARKFRVTAEKPTEKPAKSKDK
jgi:hypothetical protein